MHCQHCGSPNSRDRTGNGMGHELAPFGREFVRFKGIYCSDECALAYTAQHDLTKQGAWAAWLYWSRWTWERPFIKLRSSWLGRMRLRLRWFVWNLEPDTRFINPPTRCPCNICCDGGEAIFLESLELLPLEAESKHQ